MSPQSNRPSGFETFDHTADVGVRVWASTVPELFEQAAAGLVELMLDPDTVEDAGSMELRAEGADVEELLVAWLDEVLYAFDGQGFAPVSACVDDVTDGAVVGRLFGEPFDDSQHDVRQGVKAVTYHGLSVARRADLYEVRVIFDV